MSTMKAVAGKVAWPMGRDGQGRFLAGGPGRPFGARNRMSARAGRELLQDFRDNRDELFPRMRRWFLPQYLQLIGRMLPREVDDVGPEAAEEEISVEALAAFVAEASAVLERLKSDEAQGAETDGEAAAAATQDAG